MITNILIVLAVLLVVGIVAAISFIALVCYKFKDVPEDYTWWENY